MPPVSALRSKDGRAPAGVSAHRCVAAVGVGVAVVLPPPRGDDGDRESAAPKAARMGRVM